jgi:hypothetical protein
LKAVGPIRGIGEVVERLGWALNNVEKESGLQRTRMEIRKAISELRQTKRKKTVMKV